MIFQYGLEPVLIQRILIGSETILEKILAYLGTGWGCGAGPADTGLTSLSTRGEGLMQPSRNQ